MRKKRAIFKVLVCGCTGGVFDSNLSCYLIANKDFTNFLALDAGSLLEGISQVVKKNSLEELNVNYSPKIFPEIDFLKNQVKGYVISHAHLDHVKGLIINSSVDQKKNIYGTDTTIDHLRDHLFNHKIWPNYANEGSQPLGLYHYVRLPVGKEYLIPEVEMSVETFLLEHSKGSSSAFLIKSEGRYVIYFGDTSPDCLEKKKCLHTIWKRIAPLIRQKVLRDIFIECSYPDDCSDESLFGHFKPQYLLQELKHLAFLVEATHPSYSLRDLRVYITHIKKQHNGSRDLIMKELEKHNDLNVTFIFPSQGEILYVS